MTKRPASDAAGRAVTIVDVANAAGVSRQTVTRALNDMADISAATRERVITAAERLNYRPNRAAQGLVRGREVAIGFVVGDLRNPYYPELASELTRRAAEHGWGVMLCDLGPDPADARRWLEVVAHRVDAVVGHVGGAQWGELLAALPTVVFGETAFDEAAFDETVQRHGPSAVEIDYRPGIRAGLDHFTAGGRTSIAMIDASESPSARRMIYREYLQQHDLLRSGAFEVSGADTHEGGIDAATRLIAQYPTTDAVLVFNDVMAVGALKGFARAGRQVPADVAVIGIDGLDIGTLVTPELTSLALDKAELARHAIELVDELLSGRMATGLGTRRTIAHTLVVRESA